MWTSVSWWPVVAPAAVWRTNVIRNMLKDVGQQDEDIAASRRSKASSA